MRSSYGFSVSRKWEFGTDEQTDEQTDGWGSKLDAAPKEGHKINVA